MRGGINSKPCGFYSTTSLYDSALLSEFPSLLHELSVCMLCMHVIDVLRIGVPGRRRVRPACSRFPARAGRTWRWSSLRR